MKPGTILAIVITAIVVVTVIAYLSFRQGKAAGSDMTRQEYQHLITNLEKSMDSLKMDRQRLVDTTVAVARQIQDLNDRNDSVAGALGRLRQQHNTLKQQYAKIARYDTIRRSDIIRYVTDSLP